MPSLNERLGWAWVVIAVVSFLEVVKAAVVVSLKVHLNFMDRVIVRWISGAASELISAQKRNIQMSSTWIQSNSWARALT